jgi:DNA-binding NtrC family response regulator
MKNQRKLKGKIFLLEDDELINTMLTRVLKKEGYRVRAETAPDDIINKIESWSPDILLLDIQLPGKDGMKILKELMGRKTELQVVMLTADDTAETAVKAMKLGAADYLTKPFNMDEVSVVIQKILEKVNLKKEVGYFRSLYSEEFDQRIIGKSKAIKTLMSEINQVAHAGVSTVLITGDSGTGKELVARQIHQKMYRNAYASFIRVNCAALPETLLEAELFGYVKGAFTDAKKDKTGLFELADGGCLLLDEIGEMKPDLQSKLLRVLEDRKIRAIGGKTEVSVDVTVIATTNRNLTEEVEKGNFRLDLFYRLNTFCLHIVPLKERQEDIPVLARHFLTLFSAKYNKKDLKDFSPEAEEMMRVYSWPGNVRELKNVVERIVVLKEAPVILPEHLPAEIVSHPQTKDQPASGRFTLPESGFSLNDLERDLIIQALKRSNNNKTLAAKLLNMSYDSLRYQIKKFGLD